MVFIIVNKEDFMKGFSNIIEKVSSSGGGGNSSRRDY